MSWFSRCSWCGGPFNGGNCRRCTNVSFGDEFVRNPDPISYDETPDFSYPPPQPQYETYSCELCGNDSHYGFDCPPRLPLVYEQEPCYNQNFGDNYYPQNLPSFPQQYLCCENCGGPHANFQCQPRNQNLYEPNLCYNSNSSGFDQPKQTSIDHLPPKEMSVRELLLQEKLHKALQAVHDDDDNDDEESTIPLNEVISQIPPSIAVTPVLPIEDPEDSLIMGDENLSTIPEKESDEFIKSSVEDLVPILSESEDTSDNDSESDLPFCDNYVTFSNPLFDANDDFTSSDDESFPEEDVPKKNFKIYPNPLFEFDDEYISSDVNLFFNEVLEDIESEDSYVSKLDEPDLLVTPLSKLNKDECFDPSGDFVLKEIESCLTSDSIPPRIDDDDFDPEGDILLLEKLLNDDPSSPLPPKELNLRNLNLEDEPDEDDLKYIVKVFDPGIWEKNFSPTYVKLPFEDRHYLSITNVIRIFLPYFTYLVDASLPLSSGSEDTIFDPDISASSSYSLEPVAYEILMMIFPFFYFCPKDKGIQGEIARIMKTLVLVVLSIIHSSFNPLHAYIWNPIS
ncbi:hypothetical protein Tco_1057539 [Tanacetum coccineum]|uniref:CCHC-type domain-containing protein n=1 Tax=Tanacetum coccineum TaxID=301880 RepID=A0ABQ5H7G2_9ASTR